MPEWPDQMVLRELLDEGDHIHVATCQRDRLKDICQIAQDRFALSVREFPPFDDVDPVHVNPGSYHYRQSGKCNQRRYYSNRGNGLAADISGTRQREFYDALRKRYRVSWLRNTARRVSSRFRKGTP